MNQTLTVQSLSQEAFQKYGEYVHLAQVGPENFQLLGKSPVEFYPDLVIQNIGKSILGVSLLRVYPRAYEIEFTEHHHDTEEGLLPLDGDVFMHVGGAPQAIPDLAVEVFAVPRLTLVRLKIGVWHHAVFARGNDPVNVLILLAERTYHNDCEVVECRKGFSASP
ncbi:MAG TPA: ureidoglycolate lyase [Atribacteraceae bacterium]|nr:ureidoglycolate lyase [Atribacteraceae bacterium]